MGDEGERPRNTQRPETGDERTFPHTFGVAQIDFEGLQVPETIDEAVGQAWRAGRSITYYKREWVLTKILHTTDLGYYGRLGFVRDGEVSTLDFDPNRGDFVEGEASAGVVVPFFLGKNRRVSYQLTGAQVAEKTILSVFERLMNAGSDFFAWSISELSTVIDYESWQNEIRSVERFDFRLDRPNPHYGDDELVERLVEDTHLEYLRLVGKAKDGDIDVASDLYRQALDHVLKNYGRATVVGSDAAGQHSTWSKSKKTPGRALARIRTIGRTRSPSVEELERAAIARLPAGTQAQVVGQDGIA